MSKDIILEDLEEIFTRDIDWERFRNCTVLITGAYGMIASYVVFMLIYLNERHNYNIHIVSMIRSSEKLKARFGGYCQEKYFEIRTNSLAEPISIDDKVDYIIHAASLASPQYYGVCPVDVLIPNVIGTYYLLRLAKTKNIKGFLLFSTGDIYGAVKGITSVTETDMGVLDPLDIHSCYGESKRMAETMCYSFYHQYGVPVKIARIWHTYAPTMDIDNDPRVFASFMKNIVRGQNIEIKSDGTGKRTFCYVADAIAAFFLIMLQGKNGEAYNVCNTEQFVSIRDLAEKLISLRNDIHLQVIFKQRSINEAYTENKAIEPIAPSNQKLKDIGWNTKYNVEKGFSRVFQHQKNQLGHLGG